MSIANQFPKLHARMSERGLSPTASAGYLLDDLNSLLSPLGFRVIDEWEVIQSTLCDAEAFLSRLDKRTRTNDTPTTTGG